MEAETKIEVVVEEEEADQHKQTPPGSPQSSEPHVPRRRVSSKRKKRKDQPQLTLTIPEENTESTLSPPVVGSPLAPVTPNIEEISFSNTENGFPPLLPEFRTALTLVQVLGGGGLGIPGDERIKYSLLSFRAIITQTWLFVIRMLYIVHIGLYLSSIYYISISPLPNAIMFWPSTTLNLLAGFCSHIALNRRTDKLYLLLGTLSARQPRNIKTCIVFVLASITAFTAMATLRFYENANTHRNVDLTGSKNWTIYSFMMIYFYRNFESFFVVGSTVFSMMLYALIVAAIQFELRAIIEEPVPHESALIRHSTISKLIDYSDRLFSTLCCFWVAAVIGNISEGLGMARYHQTDFALPHITTWAHAIMLCASYFAVCECSYGVSVESERVRRWIYRHHQNDAHVLRYLHQQKRFPKSLKLWESIDLSRQAMVISVAFPVTLYAIILLILDPIKHSSAVTQSPLVDE